MVNKHMRFDDADCGYVLTLHKEAARSSETLLNPFQITRCYNPWLRSNSELLKFRDQALFGKSQCRPA